MRRLNLDGKSIKFFTIFYTYWLALLTSGVNSTYEKKKIIFVIFGLCMLASLMFLGIRTTSKIPDQPTAPSAVNTKKSVQEITSALSTEAGNEVSVSAELGTEQVATPEETELPIFITEVSTPVAERIAGYLEEQGIGYVDTAEYPLSDYARAQINRYMEQGKLVVFDATAVGVWKGIQANQENLPTPEGVIADALGGVAMGSTDEDKGSLILASAYTNPNTGNLVHTMIEVPNSGTPDGAEIWLERIQGYFENQMAERMNEIITGQEPPMELIETQTTPLTSEEAAATRLDEPPTSSDISTEQDQLDEDSDEDKI